jgi:hypothetical protein
MKDPAMNTNEKPASITMYISTNWEIIRDIETRVSSYFSDGQKDINDASMIVITELVENAVKYGVPLPGMHAIKFNFEIRDNFVEISIINAIGHEKHRTAITRLIDEINNSGNPQELYTMRLQELLNFDGKIMTGGLGLYRIAHEAKFEINYSLDGDILTVIARRPINKMK